MSVEPIERVPFPGINTFRPFVQDELNRRKNSGTSTVSSPFVRMTACTQDAGVNRMFFTLGLHGFEASDIDVFDESYGGTRDIVGYSYDMSSRDQLGNMKKRLHFSDQLSEGELPTAISETLTPAQVQDINNSRRNNALQVSLNSIVSSHPIPGIVDVSIDRTSPHSPFISKVTWNCYNRAQLEFLRNQFMITGQHVVLEWGTNFHDKKVNKIVNFGHPTAPTMLADCIKLGRNFVIQNWVEPNNGNYDLLVGTISTFSVSVDPKTGIYTCVTDIVSIGESIWGVSTHSTYFDTTEQQAQQEANIPISTIHDYMAVGGPLDEFINAQTDVSLVAPHFTNFGLDAKERNSQTNRAEGVSTNPEDYRFVSWKFFAGYIFPELIGLIKGAYVNNILLFIFDMGTDFVTKQPTDQFRPINLQNWVGNNPYLKSTIAQNMVILQSDMINFPNALNGNGSFDKTPGSDGHRGKLHTGVWLNVGMIRNAFLENTTFIAGLKQILVMMNNATENFWNLSLIWDDENALYKVVDLNFTDTERPHPDFYRFNSTNGSGASVSEMTDLKLDMSIPAELQTQMMLYARFKSETSAESRKIIKNFPSIGTTSNFMFSINWTSLTDILAPLVKPQVEYVPNITVCALPTANTTRSNVTNAGSGVVVTPTVGSKAGDDRNKPVGSYFPTNALPPAQPMTTTSRTSPGANLRERPNVGRGGGRAVRSSDVLVPDFRRIVEDVQREFSRLGYRMVLNETGRNRAQAAVYSRGGIGVSDSPHIYGRAIDMNLYDSRGRLVIKNGNNVGESDAYALQLRKRLFQAAASKYGLSGDDFKFGEHIQIGKRFDMVHVEFRRSTVNSPPIDERVLRYEGLKYEDGLTNLSNYIGRPGFRSLDPSFTPSEVVELIPVTPEEAKVAQRTADDISDRFRWSMMNMIELFPSRMKRLITINGMQSYPKPNGYVLGFPTTTAVTITLPGVSGITISDCFMVERLPHIFEKYGVFQVTTINEKISGQGWNTEIRGYFKLLKL